MAMTASSLKARIKTKIEAVNNFPETGQHPIFADERIIMALAEAIVEEIQQNAKVPFPIAVTVSTGTGIGGTTEEGTVV